MLSHVEEVGKAPLPDQAELDTLRSNVAKQQEKVDQLSTPHSSANGTEVCLSLHCPETPARCSNMGANVRQYSQTVHTGPPRCTEFCWSFLWRFTKLSWSTSLGRILSQQQCNRVAFKIQKNWSLGLQSKLPAQGQCAKKFDTSSKSRSCFQGADPLQAVLLLYSDAGVCCCEQAAGEGSKAKGQDKIVRKEAGRLTKLQEDLERIEARWGAQQQMTLKL